MPYTLIDACHPDVKRVGVLVPEPEYQILKNTVREFTGKYFLPTDLVTLYETIDRPRQNRNISHRVILENQLLTLEVIKSILQKNGVSASEEPVIKLETESQLNALIQLRGTTQNTYEELIMILTQEG